MVPGVFDSSILITLLTSALEVFPIPVEVLRRLGVDLLATSALFRLSSLLFTAFDASSCNAISFLLRIEAQLALAS
jgi:hypothetical protein